MSVVSLLADARSIWKSSWDDRLTGVSDHAREAAEAVAEEFEELLKEKLLSGDILEDLSELVDDVLNALKVEEVPADCVAALQHAQQLVNDAVEAQKLSLAQPSDEEQQLVRVRAKIESQLHPTFAASMHEDTCGPPIYSGSPRVQIMNRISSGNNNAMAGCSSCREKFEGQCLCR